MIKYIKIILVKDRLYKWRRFPESGQEYQWVGQEGCGGQKICRIVGHFYAYEIMNSNVWLKKKSNFPTFPPFFGWGGGISHFPLNPPLYFGNFGKKQNVGSTTKR